MYTQQLSFCLDRVTPSSVSPPPTATFTSTQPIAPTPSAIPTTGTPQEITTDFPTMDLAGPPRSDQLAGVIVGALLTAVALVLIVVLIIFLVLLLRKRRGEKLYNVPVPPQPQNTDNPVYTIEVKNNEAYSTTHQIPTQDNVAYIQTTPQISTEDNVAYGQKEDDYTIVSDQNEYDYICAIVDHT